MGQITIGTGTSTQRDPFNFFYGYGRDASIYTSAEMNTTVSGGTITTLSWYSNLTSGWVTGPVKIYLKPIGSTTAVTDDTWANTISGATQVYSATPTWANGWNLIDITDFPISANQNLLVLVECNYTGSGTSPSTGNAIRYSTGGTNSHAYWQADTSPPTGVASVAGGRNTSRPNIILGGLAAPAPSCATTPVPSTAATGINATQQLSWAATSGATSYDVYFGTATNPSFVTNVTTTTYNPGGLLTSTTYYWKILPKNASGTASGCSEWTFTTGANVNMSTGTITKCSGNFYDSGGSASNYALSEDYTLTICPISSSDKVRVAFSSFATETGGYDGLVIYNGNSTAAPLISSGLPAGPGNSTNCPAGSYYNTTSPGTVTSSSVDGCLTFRFRSDGVTNAAGWVATVSCITPVACPSPVSAAATLITYNSAQANWDLSTGNFILEYGPTSTFGTPGTGATAGNINNTIVTVSNNNKSTLSSLFSSTGYSYVVRQDCTNSSNGYSLNSNTTTFTTSVAPPVNDDCGTATSLIVGNGFPCSPSNPFSWANATASSGVAAPTCGSYSTGDIWYTFTLNSDATVIINTAAGTGANAITDGAMTLYSGACGSLVDVECDDDDGAGSMPQIKRFLTAGTYYVRFWDYDDKTTADFGGICVNAITPLTNDNCSGVNGTPVVLTPQSYATSCASPVSATTVGATQSNTDCTPSGTFSADDVWFQFTTGAGITSQTIRFQNVVTAFGTTATSMALSTYTTCGGTSSNCTTAVSLTSGAGQTTLTGLTANTTYYLRVWTNTDTDNGVTFDICVIDPQPMTYVSSAITQQTGTTGAGSSYQKILQLNVVVISTLNPLSVTQLDFSTAGTPGTSLPADITNARVYYTEALLPGRMVLLPVRNSVLPQPIRAAP